MTTFNRPAGSSVVPPIRVAVTIGGATRSDVECTMIDQSAGVEGAVASFAARGEHWDSELRTSLLYRRVVVTVDGSVVFFGWVDSTDATTSGDSFGFSARSPLGWSDRVLVGQAFAPANDLTARYARRERFAGVPRNTGWTAVALLRDLFSGRAAQWFGGGGSIPSDWRAAFRLGSLAPVAGLLRGQALTDLVIRQQSFRDALARVLAVSPLLGCYESFTATGSVLEFYNAADPFGPARVVRIAARGTGVAGTNVRSAGNTRSTSEVISQVYGVGAPKRYTITLTTAMGGDGLIAGWDPADEAAVLADLGKTDDDGSRPNDQDARLKRVFRRFLLPAWIKSLGFTVERATSLQRADGTPLPPIVFRTRVASYIVNPEDETESVAVIHPNPRVERGAQLDLENGEITLAEPALNLTAYTVDPETGQVSQTLSAALVGVTLTLASRDHVTATTGVRGPALEGVPSGLSRAFTDHAFQFHQVGASIGGVSFGAQYPTLDDPDDWDVITPGNSLILRNDARALLQRAEFIRRGGAMGQSAYPISLAFVSRAYRIGDRIRIVGERNADGGHHVVSSIRHILGRDHATELDTQRQSPTAVFR